MSYDWGLCHIGGSELTALATGWEEELLVYRVSWGFVFPPVEVVTLGRTPELSFMPVSMMPGGMVALTPDWVLVHGGGSFYALCPGCDPIPVASDRAPQIGLVADRYGLIYSATTIQVLRFIPANTVVLSLRLQAQVTAGALLSIISPPGRQVRVEQSRAFGQWEPWQTLTSTGQDSAEVKPESDRLFLRGVLLP